MKNFTKISARWHSTHVRGRVRVARAAYETPWLRLLYSVVLLYGSLAACNADEGRTLKDATVTVACASCVFQMEGAVGCPFAAEIEGEHYMIQGRVPEGHESHAPDGICNMRRQAKVDGHLRDGKLITTRLELLPATEVPQHPRFTTEDIHP